MIHQLIKALVDYGYVTGLLESTDRIYTTNRLLEVLHLNAYEEPLSTPYELSKNASATDLSDFLEEILSHLLDYAAQHQLLEDNTIQSRDLFDTKLMGCLLGRPSDFQQDFAALYKTSPESATNYFYKYSQDTDYIRRYRIKKDQKWKVSSPYGMIDITINLAKPEKDPKAIAAARNTVATNYPKCLLCSENEGYAGHDSHPARQNHRIVPITIQEQNWGFQYSPYVYYNEHCIVFNGDHTPMQINRATFHKLFDFVNIFPHYFVGSNADLPIVGGSILSHDHFQGGHYSFAMENANIEQVYQVKGYEEVSLGILHWPLSVLRLQSKNQQRLIDLGEHILNQWRNYTDEDANIIAYTKNIPHNTITPIARKVGDTYELDLALRNNITTLEHPFGLFHPHEHLHHIKKENIGLIEVMGLAVLPSRLKTEIELLAKAMIHQEDINTIPAIQKHSTWVKEFLPHYEHITPDNIHGIIKEEIGKVFIKVLEDAGVYKTTPKGRMQFEQFILSL